MAFETLKEALRSATKEDMALLIERAKEIGYEPRKVSSVIKQRDALLSAKAAAERESDDYKGKALATDDAFKVERNRAEDAIKNLEEIKGKYKDFEAIQTKVAKYEEIEQNHKTAVETEYNELLNRWEKTDDKIGVVIPPIEDIDKKLKWMKDNEARLFPGGRPVITPETPPEPKQPMPDSIKKEADRIGISPQKLMDIKNKKKD